MSVMTLLFICFAQWYVYKQHQYTYTSVQAIPHNKVGVVLGTSKFLRNGRSNLFYQNRIKAAVELYKAGKIDYILVSGDNGHESYDEPTDMKDDLAARGVPANKIFLDYAGFRTLDSMVRAKEVFGQSNFTVISQAFHNERAIAIGHWKGYNVVGYNAKAVGGKNGLKVLIREFFARVKMMIDMVLGIEPKFYGAKINIH